MPAYPDAVVMLRQLRPADGLVPDPALLERILGTPPGPVRVVEHVEGATTAASDYVLAERLPRTPANERLLRMSPHPGAKRVTEGRL